ncbi:hypothetical protein AQUCO_07200037v1 [Aquilegia coerulea]|uniref:CCHC-type domain-containing protein n=1 Tax=Aquilegia coerulea TaxID=218851 RepID=A0A2G5CA22_AQUCA|nr:hypothetical protein AQUCO_07200037v1 [Aquilegia coerulea]
MSLHLGDIPSHIREDDLALVFCKFGRNSIQLKNGYGFVLYDNPADAERAFRALKGKYICGEKIFLTWSNNQPKPLLRESKGSRSYGPYHERVNNERENYERSFRRRKDYAIRKQSIIRHEREFKRPTRSRKQDDKGGGFQRESFLGKEDSYRRGNVVNRREEKFEIVKKGFVDERLPRDHNFTDSGRWGESVNAVSGKKEADNEVYHGYDRRNDENCNRTAPHSSSARRSSGERSRKDRFANIKVKHADNPMYQVKCYHCGQTGHIKRNCPQGNALKPEKLTRLNHRQDSDFRFTGKGDLKRVRPASCGRSSSSRSPPPSRRYNRDSKSLCSPRLGRKGSQLVKGKELLGKNKRKREDGISVKEGTEAEKAGSLFQHSDSSASSSSLRSTSGSSSRSRSRSCSRSRSRSRSRARSRSRSVSSCAYSLSPSPSSMPKSSKPRSENFKSRSPASLSLSESLGQPLPSSPRNAEVVKNCSFPQNNVNEDNLSPPKLVVTDQRLITGDEASSEKPNLKSTNGTISTENGILSPEVAGEMDVNYHGELHDDGLDRTGYEAKEESGEEKNFQISDSPEVEGIPSTVQMKKSIKISQQEMYMVLKHYGLAMPNENEENLSLESYFGSARLWPWEIIYYRRSKKGTISAENYARRMAQNEEFGIVDKYIRSSSGWEDCEENNC